MLLMTLFFSSLSRGDKMDPNIGKFSNIHEALTLKKDTILKEEEIDEIQNLISLYLGKEQAEIITNRSMHAFITICNTIIKTLENKYYSGNDEEKKIILETIYKRLENYTGNGLVLNGIEYANYLFQLAFFDFRENISFDIPIDINPSVENTYTEEIFDNFIFSNRDTHKVVLGFALGAGHYAFSQRVKYIMSTFDKWKESANQDNLETVTISVPGKRNYFTPYEVYDIQSFIDKLVEYKYDGEKFFESNCKYPITEETVINFVQQLEALKAEYDSLSDDKIKQKDVIDKINLLAAEYDFSVEDFISMYLHVENQIQFTDSKGISLSFAGLKRGTTKNNGINIADYLTSYFLQHPNSVVSTFLCTEYSYSMRQLFEVKVWGIDHLLSLLNDINAQFYKCDQQSIEQLKQVKNAIINSYYTIKNIKVLPKGEKIDPNKGVNIIEIVKIINTITSNKEKYINNVNIFEKLIE